MDLTSLRNSIRERFTSDWRRVDWPRTALLVGLILALYAALWQWVMPQVRIVNTREFVRVPEISKARDVQRVRVACPEEGIVALDTGDGTIRHGEQRHLSGKNHRLVAGDGL